MQLGKNSHSKGIGEVDCPSPAQWRAPVTPAALEVGPGGQTAAVSRKRKGGWKGLEGKGRKEMGNVLKEEGGAEEREWQKRVREEGRER